MHFRPRGIRLRYHYDDDDDDSCDPSEILIDNAYVSYIAADLSLRRRTRTTLYSVFVVSTRFRYAYTSTCNGPSPTHAPARVRVSHTLKDRLTRFATLFVVVVVFSFNPNATTSCLHCPYTIISFSRDRPAVVHVCYLSYARVRFSENVQQNTPRSVSPRPTTTKNVSDVSSVFRISRSTTNSNTRFHSVRENFLNRFDPTIKIRQIPPTN